MNVVTGIVLFAIIWFMALFVVLPFRFRSQGEVGTRVAGTPASAPEDPQMKRRFIATTILAAVIWAIVAFVILSDLVSLSDFDLFSRFGLGRANY